MIGLLKFSLSDRSQGKKVRRSRWNEILFLIKVKFMEKIHLLKFTYEANNFRAGLHQSFITSLLVLERLAENVKLFKRSFEM